MIHHVRSHASAFVLVLLLTSACGGAPASARSAETVPSVAVAAVERIDLAQPLTLSAEFRPFQEVDVHAKIAGYVKSISVDVGDRVKSGELLAVLEVPELQDEAAQDDAAVRRAAEDIKRAQADLTRAESAHDVSHLASTRLAGVLKDRPNLVAQQDIDEATGRDRVAEAQIATAKASLAAAQEQLAMSQAAAGKTRTLMQYARISAPFDGVVTRRYADTGAMIQAGTSSQTQTMPLVRISDNARLRLTIGVPESAVARIHAGDPVDVHVDALGRTISGRVSRVSGAVNGDTRTMPVEVDVANADLALVPGMFASASFALDRAPNALAVPVQAIDRQDRGASVLAVVNGKVERRAVTLGIETPDRVQITNGLDEHDFVVVGNRGQLRPGTAIKPVVAEKSASGTRRAS